MLALKEYASIIDLPSPIMYMLPFRLPSASRLNALALPSSIRNTQRCFSWECRTVCCWTYQSPALMMPSDNVQQESSVVGALLTNL